MIQSDHAIHHSLGKWRNVLPDFDVNEHIQSLLNLTQISNATKLRNFQYKIMHGKIFCNNILYHWKIKSNQRCDFCQEPKQDAIHLLVDCVYAKNLWNFIKTIFLQLGVKNDLTPEVIIWNRIQKPWCSVTNFIILVTKFFIYKSKIQDKLPNVIELCNELDLWYCIEKYNADTNLIKHRKKWGPVTQILGCNCNEV